MNTKPIEAENELLRRAQQGDSSVIARLYDRYQRGIFRYLYYRVGDRPTAEDLTSEVFLRMLSALSQTQHNVVSFQAWLFQIARNLSIDYYRKAGARLQTQLQEGLLADDGDPVDVHEQGLTSDRLRRSLAKLTDDQRDVIILRFVAGMPIGQVAFTLHKSEDAVKGLQRRALIALRQVLEEWEVGDV